MLEVLARCVILFALGILLLVWMLLALAVEALSEGVARRRMTTHFVRNPGDAARSYIRTHRGARS